MYVCVCRTLVTMGHLLCISNTDRNDNSASENEIMLPTDQVVHSK